MTSSIVKGLWEFYFFLGFFNLTMAVFRLVRLVCIFFQFFHLMISGIFVFSCKRTWVNTSNRLTMLYVGVPSYVLHY